MGIALTVYGREEEADTLIEQMTRDQDPILRYGGMYALALAYSGTANNKAIRQLLHFAVSDVSDDVRRTAVLALGFVLYSEPEQVQTLFAKPTPAQTRKYEKNPNRDTYSALAFTTSAPN